MKIPTRPSVLPLSAAAAGALAAAVFAGAAAPCAHAQATFVDYFWRGTDGDWFEQTPFHWVDGDFNVSDAPNRGDAHVYIDYAYPTGPNTAVNATVTLASGRTAAVEFLSISAGDKLVVNGTLNFAGTNSGDAASFFNIINLQNATDSTHPASEIQLSGALTFDGPSTNRNLTINAGLVTMNGGSIYSASTGGVLHLNGTTLQGSGTLGDFGNPNGNVFRATSYDNNGGVIQAYGAGATLNIQLRDDNGNGSYAVSTFNNHNGGILGAANGGILNITPYSDTATIANAGGTIRALDGSTVNINSGVTISGGSLVTDANSTIHGLGGTLFDVTNLGSVQVNRGNTLTLLNNFVNNGALLVGGTDANVMPSQTNTNTSGGLLIAANNPNNRMTLSGGVITLSDNASNYIDGVTSGTQLDIAAGATIQGGGAINLFLGGGHVPTIYNLTIANAGLINANAPSNALNLNLVTDTSNPTGLTNTGTLRASNGGTLRFAAASTGGGYSGVVDNTGGTIEALDNSTVRIGSTLTVQGGTLSTSGSGTIRGDNAGSGGGTLRDLTNAGTIVISGGESLGFAGTITNNGAVRLDANTSSSQSSGSAGLYINGNTTLAGTGALSMLAYGNFINAPVNTSANLTVAPGATIAGIGVINDGFNGHLTVNNQGLINANITGTLQVNLNADANYSVGLTNTGTLRADGAGSTLAIGLVGQGGGLGANITNNGTIEALNGGQVILSGPGLTNNSNGTLSGGTYRADGSGSTVNLGGTAVTSLAGGAQVIVNGANAQVLAGNQSVLGSLTTNGAGSAVRLLGANTYNLSGGFTNSGVFNVHDSGTVARIGSGEGSFTQTGTGTLSGTGTLAASSLTLSGTISPGNSPGTLTLQGNVITDASTVFFFELGSSLVGPNDHLNITGAFTLDGTLNIAALAGFGTGTYDLIDFNGALTNNGLELGTLPNGTMASLLVVPSVPGVSEGSVELIVTNAAVPEPRTWAMVLGAGLLLVGLQRRRLLLRTETP